MGNPVIFIDPTGKGVTDNYKIYTDGSIAVQKTDDKTDNFKYVNDDDTETDLGTYEKTDNGLIRVPNGKSELFINNSDLTCPGKDRNYLIPTGFAAVLGAAYEYMKETDLRIQINQLSGIDGGHSGHGGNGQYADIRYSNTRGNKNEVVWTNASNFDKVNSQLLANKFIKFGYSTSILTENATGNGPALR